MSNRQLIWHFVSHFSIAFTVAALVILTINWINAGIPTVSRWTIPFGTGLAVGIVTTVLQARKSDGSKAG